MPAKGNSAEKRAARRIQTTLNVPYTNALRLLREKKHAGINWTEAADVVLAEKTGPGLFEES